MAPRQALREHLLHGESERLLSAVANDPPHLIHSLSNSLNWDTSKVLKALIYLEKKGKLTLEIVVYHLCEDGDRRVCYRRSLKAGFPAPPFACSECDIDEEDPLHLSFDFEARPI